MPEYVLDESNAPDAWENASDIVKGFIEALFFTETCSGVSYSDWFESDNQADLEAGRLDGSIPGDSGVEDITPESLAKVIAFCDKWQADHADLIEEAIARPGYDLHRLGNDLFYTHVGHGVGFWDRSELDDDSPEYEELTEQLRAASESGDNAAWSAIAAKRRALSDQSLGQRLTKAAGRGEVTIWPNDLDGSSRYTLDIDL